MRQIVSLSVFIFLLVLTGSYLYKKLPAESPSHSVSSAESKYCRIISLAPNITETVFALGLSERVVGVTRFCLYPPEAQEKGKVGGFMDPNYEAIAVLQPETEARAPPRR